MSDNQTHHIQNYSGVYALEVRANEISHGIAVVEIKIENLDI